MRTTLFDSSFFGPRRPAWQHLGPVTSARIGAVEAFRHAGPYDVILAPSATPDSWDIRRKPTRADPHWHDFGTVGPDYVLVPPDEITEIWDINVRKPVETLGALQHGRCLFITAELPSYEVRGDPVDSYLILAHTMDADGTTEIFNAPVRVVCQNTLMLARRSARKRITVVQGPDAQQRLADKLDDAVRGVEVEALAARRDFELLADRRAGAADVSAVLEAVYPSNQARRDAVLELFEGEGVGMDVPAARGTLWGLYNAVAELENFRDNDTLEGAAYSVLFGARGAAIARAFSAALRCCGGQSGQAEAEPAQTQAVQCASEEVFACAPVKDTPGTDVWEPAT